MVFNNPTPQPAADFANLMVDGSSIQTIFFDGPYIEEKNHIIVKADVSFDGGILYMDAFEGPAFYSIKKNLKRSDRTGKIVLFICLSNLSQMSSP